MIFTKVKKLNVRQFELMSSFYEASIENERDAMQKEALKIALEQAKYNIHSMFSLLEVSTNKIKINRICAGLVANEVNTDAMILNIKEQYNNSNESNTTQFQTNNRNFDQKKKEFIYKVVEQNNNSYSSNQNQSFFPKNNRNNYNNNNYSNNNSNNNNYNNFRSNNTNYNQFNNNNRSNFNNNQNNASQRKALQPIFYSNQSKTRVFSS